MTIKQGEKEIKKCFESVAVALDKVDDIRFETATVSFLIEFAKKIQEGIEKKYDKKQKLN